MRLCLGEQPTNLRRALSLSVALALIAPAAGRAATDRQFNAGSIIIPMSLDYQTGTGVVASYGLVYNMLARNTDGSRITIYWAVQSKKRSQYHCYPRSDTVPSYGSYNDDDGCDFYVENLSGGQPVKLVSSADASGLATYTQPFSGTGIGYNASDPNGPGPCDPRGPGNCAGSGTYTVNSTRLRTKYLGAAWVVSAGPDTTEFLRRLYDGANYPELAQYRTVGGANYVNVHWANAQFTAPVVSAIQDKPPRIALVGTNSGTAAKLQNVLTDAGICPTGVTTTSPCSYTFPGTTPTSWTPGTVYDFYQDIRQLLDDDPTRGFPHGRVNGTGSDGLPLYGIVWLGDDAFTPQTVSNLTDTNHDLSNLNRFVQGSSNALFVGYASIPVVEVAASYQTSTGALTGTPAQSNVPTYEDCADSQPGVAFFSGNGNPCIIYGAANQPYAQTGNAVYANGNGSLEGYKLSAGNTWKSGTSQILQIVNNAGATTYSVATAIQPVNQALVMYLAGFKYTNNSHGVWGERLVLNTLFAGLHAAPSEFARSEPVGYDVTTGTTTTSYVFQGTFVPRADPADNDLVTYDSSHPEKWQFPYTAGHLYSYNLANLSTSATAQAFGSSANTSAATWDAATQLAAQSPGSRVVFTFVGSSPTPSAPYLGSGNLGWKKIYFYRDLKNVAHDEASATCVDANGDGYCDLSQMLAATNTGLGSTIAPLSKSAPDAAMATRIKLFLRQVLGFCVAHDPGGNLRWDNDDPSNCDNPYNATLGTGQTNKATLGGIDHSTPAVVGPSKLITGAQWAGDSPYENRPVVAYAGGADGMLHAFYVGGSTTWSADGYSLPSGVTAGQELWAMVPPGQVGDLGFNMALVDGAINVVDVFGDFPYDANHDGTIDWTTGAYDPASNTGEAPNHRRRWRTVLVATVGQQQQSAWAKGSEVFALDVTNPLNPVLLWRIGGATENDGRFDRDGNGIFAGVSTEAYSSTDPSTYALKWSDTDTTNYLTPTAAALTAMQCGRYDYSNLGSAYSTAVAKVWNGGAYQYALFVATNAAQFAPSSNTSACGSSTVGRGAEIFAVDVVTGQKLWQWERDYKAADLTASGVDNSVPPRLALGDIDVNGSTDRVYLGDMAGHLWELFVRDGRNVNYLPDKLGTYHSFPLFGTPAMVSSGNSNIDAMYQVNGSSPLSQQPLTTPIGQGRFTAVPASPASLSVYIPNRLSLIVGTMGVNWNIAQYEAGHIFVVPISPDTGLKLTQAELDAAGTAAARRTGVIRQGASWDIALGTNERVYGMPRVVNNTILFNTAYGGSYATDDIATTATNPGRLWITSSAGSTQSDNDSKSFGGVLVFERNVIVTTDTSIHKLASPPAAVTSAPALSVQPFNRSTPAAIKTWEELTR